MLKEYIENIRAAYTRDLTSEDDVKQQKAVAVYLIDKHAFRADGAKIFGLSVCYGCCALKVENVRATSPSSLEFNFQEKGTSKVTGSSTSTVTGSYLDKSPFVFFVSKIYGMESDREICEKARMLKVMVQIDIFIFNDICASCNFRRPLFLEVNWFSQGKIRFTS